MPLKPRPPYDPNRWPEHPALLAIVAWYVAGALLVSHWQHAPGMMAAMRSTLFYQLALLLSVPYLVWRAIQRRMAARDQDGRRLAAVPAWKMAWSDLCRAELSARSLRDVAFLTILVGLFLNAFSCWKYEMEAIRPFSTDAILSRLDLLVHGGVPPWLVLQPWLGHPAITHFIDWSYEGVWFTCVTLAAVAAAWQEPSLDRTRFFLAFLLTWAVLGTGLAYLCPSAGPAYYHLVVAGPDPYQGLREYLAAVGQRYDLATLHIQPALWTAGERGVSTVGSGIAAMPSMHVAIPALLVCANWRTRRVLSVLLTAYTCFVIIGSIHLGWHYAVDGYIAALFAWVIWHIAGRLTRRMAHQHAPNTVHSALPRRATSELVTST